MVLRKENVFLFIAIIIIMWFPILYWKLTAYNINRVSLYSKSEVYFHINTTSDRTLGTRIGVLIPSTSRGIEIFKISSFSLLTTSLKSLNETKEIGYNYAIYIGIDIGDRLHAHRKYIEKLYSDTVIVPVRGKTFTEAINTIAKRAVNDGMDYLVRINDDIKFKTKNWTSLSIKALRNYKPSNVGVVGPNCKQGNTAIMTTDFVHVTHFNIFGFYYPPQLDNWWVDGWITRVYQPSRSQRVQSWEVVHTMEHKRRYHVNTRQKEKLEQLINVHNQQVIFYINQLQLNTSAMLIF